MFHARKVNGSLRKATEAYGNLRKVIPADQKRSPNGSFVPFTGRQIGSSCAYETLPMEDSTVERKSHSIRGTARQLERQINMNEHPRSKRIHGARANRTPHAISTAGSSGRLKAQMPERKQLPPAPIVPFKTARGLLICLGWLRLYQCIISPSYATVARRGLRYEPGEK